jgi:hypothetical protein
MVHKNVELYGITFVLLSIFFNSLEIINGLKIVFFCATNNMMYRGSFLEGCQCI